MIGWLRGRLLCIEPPNELVLDVAGVGYRLQVPSRVLARLGPPGSETELFVHTHLRQDALVLYGFQDLDERRCFEVLLGAHGVGPSLALGILSVMTPDALAAAVEAGDVDRLLGVPGVGRKTAARLLLELRSRLGSVGGADPSLGGIGEDQPQTAAADALADLGYGPEEVRAALAGVDPAAPVEDQLRSALRHLAGAR
ncbi:Holliday junction branch migration protein RuvA [Aciditerrimonas ferrireducens]|uniref:Holliday junction branch migration protein RuvA n=1 Tax=Aciditerrimonas ferrireducens TaxID=667306 RepID=UPI0020056222|nr:Holliday junction branch migration protein RuvA [Aciditerrimonas ferrireducens]MCK4177212.1 Holliday junction branch migration protein RuvA [Aciditerrimonas ferrireducens]